MENGIMVEIAYFDEHLIEVQFYASSGRFSGSTGIYLEQGDLSKFGQAIRGFPKNNLDTLAYDFGVTDPDCAGGYFKISLKTDFTGHVSAAVIIRDDCQGDSLCQANFTINLVAGDIDRFESSLYEIERNKSGSSFLRAQD